MQALQDLVRRANEGNEKALSDLRILLDQHPEIWRTAGDVSALAERAWVALLASDNRLASESIPRKLREMKAALAGNQPTPLEKLLVDLVGVGWLASCHAEYTAAAPPGGSLQQARYRLRRAESAQRRLLSSVKMLALLRALVPRGMLPLANGTNADSVGPLDLESASG